MASSTAFSFLLARVVSIICLCWALPIAAARQ